MSSTRSKHDLSADYTRKLLPSLLTRGVQQIGLSGRYRLSVGGRTLPFLSVLLLPPRALVGFVGPFDSSLGLSNFS